jgi:hypothetical protein
MGLERRPVLRAAPANAVHYEWRRPEQTTLYRLVREHLETFLAQVEAGGAASLPQFVKDEFDAFPKCGILAHGFLRLRRAGCGHEKLVAFSCKRRGICPSCTGRLTAQHVADTVAVSEKGGSKVLCAEAFAKMLDSPLRVVLEITPVKFITYDGVKMFQHTAGQLDPSQLAPPLESDTVRLEAELKKRGLKA